MHGRPRTTPSLDPSRQKLEEAKTASFQALLQQVLRNHRDLNFSKEALSQNAKLLETNPEVYTAWNYRKLAVTHLFDSLQDEPARKAVLDNELHVIERALMRNFKSYGAWHHRKWVLQYGLSSWEHEYRLLDKLSSDARNFHGWAYRRFLAKIKKAAHEDELQFTIKKINENFSNYSAWHSRSVLLSKQFLDDTTETETWHQVLTEEYDLVKQAFFTEPEDQSGWFYLEWLLSQTVIPSCPWVSGIWPPNGSSIILNLDAPSKRRNLIVICFSLPVRGVDKETVSVKVSTNAELELSWIPVPETSHYSQVWTSDLGASGKCLESGSSHTVVLEIGSIPGIFSRNGPLVDVQQFSFNLKLYSSGVAASYEQDGLNECVAWPENCKESNQRFDQSAENTFEEPILHHTRCGEGLSDWQKETLQAQIDTCRELLDLEEDSKWAMLMLARLLVAHNHHASPSEAFIGEVQKLYKSLMKVDPTHGQFYDEQLSLLCFNQITSSVHDLSKYYWTSHQSDSDQELWLRFTNLSLSKIGYFERLIGLQRLDLSYNKLHSLEGLECLQYLINLDASHNQLSSVMSLRPMSHLRKLQALNIKWNEIGLHPVDTSRYLFPTALSNTAENVSSKIVEHHRSPAYWEVFEVFGCMGIQQLDIHGNPILADVNFKHLLTQALSSLVWLDGVRVSSLLRNQNVFC